MYSKPSSPIPEKGRKSAGPSSSKAKGSKKIAGRRSSRASKPVIKFWLNTPENTRSSLARLPGLYRDRKISSQKLRDFCYFFNTYLGYWKFLEEGKQKAELSRILEIIESKLGKEARAYVETGRKPLTLLREEAGE